MVKTKPYRVVIEDLNVSGMMKNKHLSDSVRKQCFHNCGAIIDRDYNASLNLSMYKLA